MRLIRFDAKQKQKALICTIIFSLIIIIDQIIKIYIKTHFLPGEQLKIASWFQIVFVENEGMAFGMDFIATKLLALFRIIAIPCFIFLVANSIALKKKIGFSICLTLIAAGATGNIIDNMFYGLGFNNPNGLNQPAQWLGFGHGYGGFLEGKVVDMFYFPLFVWPDAIPIVGGHVFFNAIFNFADAAISCGAILLLLFYTSQLSHSKKHEI